MDVRLDGDHPSASITYDVGAEHVERVLRLEQADGHWRLAESLASLATLLSDIHAPLMLEGVSVPEGPAGGPGTIASSVVVWLYPGEYELTADVDSSLLDVTTIPQVVLGGASSIASLWVSIQLSARVTDAAAASAAAWLAACPADNACQQVPSETWGADAVMQSMSSSSDGIGGFTVDVQLSSVDGEVDLSGFSVRYDVTTEGDSWSEDGPTIVPGLAP